MGYLHLWKPSHLILELCISTYFHYGCKFPISNLYIYYILYIYGYGSIPISTIFSGMNIHLPAILGFTRYQGFDPSPYIFPHISNHCWLIPHGSVLGRPQCAGNDPFDMPPLKQQRPRGGASPRKRGIQATTVQDRTTTNTCIYIYTHTGVYIYTQVCVYIYTGVCVYIYILVYTHAHV